MKSKQNKLPLIIRLNCWLCKRGIQEMFCKICPPVLPLTEEEKAALKEELLKEKII
jgi:hypothetical protein